MVAEEVEKNLKEMVGVGHRLSVVAGHACRHLARAWGGDEDDIDELDMVMYAEALVPFGRMQDALIRVGAEEVVMDTFVDDEGMEE